MIRVAFEPDSFTALLRMLSRHRASLSALSFCAHSHCQRLHPAMQQKAGVRVERAAEMVGLCLIRSIRSAGPITAPATMSECPLRYLVPLWSERSNPISAGRKLIGLAKVLSMMETSPFSRRNPPPPLSRPLGAADWSSPRRRSPWCWAKRSASPRRVGIDEVDARPSAEIRDESHACRHRGSSGRAYAAAREEGQQMAEIAAIPLAVTRAASAFSSAASLACSASDWACCLAECSGGRGSSSPRSTRRLRTGRWAFDAPSMSGSGSPAWISLVSSPLIKSRHGASDATTFITRRVRENRCRRACRWRRRRCRPRAPSRGARCGRRARWFDGSEISCTGFEPS